MDVVFKIFKIVLNEPTGYSIVRDKKEYHLTEEELQRAVFFHYSRLLTAALHDSGNKTGKNMSDEQMRISLAIAAEEKAREIVQKKI